MTASQQPDAERAPLTSPAAAGSGSTGHDKAVEWLAGVLYGENPDVDRGSAVHWMLASRQSRVALAALRAALAAGDPDVAGPVAEALGLSEQVRGCDHGFIHPDPDLPQVWSSNVPCPTADQRRFVTDWTDAP